MSLGNYYDPTEPPPQLIYFLK